MFTTTLVMKSWFRAVAAACPDEGIDFSSHISLHLSDAKLSFGANLGWCLNSGILRLYWLLVTFAHHDWCLEMDFLPERMC